MADDEKISLVQFAASIALIKIQGAWTLVCNNRRVFLETTTDFKPAQWITQFGYTMLSIVSTESRISPFKMLKGQFDNVLTCDKLISELLQKLPHQNFMLFANNMEEYVSRESLPPVNNTRKSYPARFGKNVPKTNIIWNSGISWGKKKRLGNTMLTANGFKKLR